MSMVHLPGSRCGAETLAPIVGDHTREECDAQVAENERYRVIHAKQREEWEAKIAKLKAEGKPLPPAIKLPHGRIVKPSEWMS